MVALAFNLSTGGAEAGSDRWSVLVAGALLHWVSWMDSQPILTPASSVDILHVTGALLRFCEPLTSVVDPLVELMDL